MKRLIPESASAPLRKKKGDPFFFRYPPFTRFEIRAEKLTPKKSKQYPPFYSNDRLDLL